MLPPELDSPGALPQRPRGALRVVVAGATGASGGAAVAAMLAAALLSAGLGNDSVEIVHTGATLDGVCGAAADGAWRVVVVTGAGTLTLTAAFAMVKAASTRHPGARIEVLVTGLDETRAHAAYQHVRAAAGRFLGRDVGFAGAFPDVDAAPAHAAGSARAATPSAATAVATGATRGSRAARMWAARLLAECSEGAWPEAAHSSD